MTFDKLYQFFNIHFSSLFFPFWAGTPSIQIFPDWLLSMEEGEAPPPLSGEKPLSLLKGSLHPTTLTWQ